MVGVRMTQAQLMDILGQFGFESVPTEGMFDPSLHEAVERVPTAEPCEGTIVGVVRPGYKLHDRLLRPAQVKVAVRP
jgi:molecular chaperone GrpE